MDFIVTLLRMLLYIVQLLLRSGSKVSD